MLKLYVCLGSSKVIVIVPWIVIQELDYMKDGRFGSNAIKPLASKAINFINNELLLNPQRFKGIDSQFLSKLLLIMFGF